VIEIHAGYSYISAGRPRLIPVFPRFYVSYDLFIGGSTPHSAPHRVLIWDDHVPKEIGELSFRQVVLRVRLRKDAIAVALRDRVYVYHLADLSLRDKIYTADNPHGLLSLSTQVQEMILACPSVTTGHVRVELYGLRKTVVRDSARKLSLSPLSKC
jgi:hypothetical protein